MRSSCELISETVRLRSIDMRCSLVRPSLRCAFKCRMTFHVRQSSDCRLLQQFLRQTKVCRTSKQLQLVICKVAQICSVATAGARNRISLLVKFHSKVQAHAVEYLFDFIERLLAEVLGSQHLAFATLHQVANRANVSILQTVVRTHR